MNGMGKSVDVSQARLDILAFSKLAAINHQRIRRVAASSWTFRATDFANRIVKSFFTCICVGDITHILGKVNEC